MTSPSLVDSYQSLEETYCLQHTLNGSGCSSETVVLTYQTAHNIIFHRSENFIHNKILLTYKARNYLAVHRCLINSNSLCDVMIAREENRVDVGIVT